jgi:phytoene dehydrogenase-like protein
VLDHVGSDVEPTSPCNHVPEVSGPFPIARDGQYPLDQCAKSVCVQILDVHELTDAAGQIVAPSFGAWTPDLAEAYAQRVLARLGRHVVNLDRATIRTAVLSPADLERHNVNLVDALRGH